FALSESPGQPRFSTWPGDSGPASRRDRKSSGEKRSGRGYNARRLDRRSARREVPMFRTVRLVPLLAVSLALAALLAPPARSQVKRAEITKLIEQLGDDDEDVRKKAEKRLLEIGEPAAAALRKASKTHADPDVRLRAVVLAGRIDKNLFGAIR